MVTCRCGFDRLTDCERWSADVEKITLITPCEEVFEKQTCYGRTSGPTAYAKGRHTKIRKHERKLQRNQTEIELYVITTLPSLDKFTSSIWNKPRNSEWWVLRSNAGSWKCRVCSPLRTLKQQRNRNAGTLEPWNLGLETALALQN